MKLSVVIVNYNVRFFLEQCLQSVTKASEGLRCEIFVVDNNSSDDSMEMVREKFPEVKRIENKENVGFSKANNQAIKQASGEYILLLNPDTVVEETCFEKCTEFLDKHTDAGGLGVKMVDGKGEFLPESKRGLPTPSVAFYKIFGLSALFPKSKQFGKYHLGFLDKDKTHEIEVLSGACMFLRKSVLDKIGLLDETFFMYGEDIDLSYRVMKGGYKNYYYPEARIIHYKGESTKKSSINYVFVFYRAMIIFAHKHFSGKNAKTFSRLINMAIYLRAFIAILSRFIRRITMPLIDSAVLMGGMMVIKNHYEKIKFGEEGGFPEHIVWYSFLIMTAIWIVSLLLNGAYDHPRKIGKVIRGAFIGSIVILIAYALLDEDHRFSRAVVFFSTLWAVLALPLMRLILHITGIYPLEKKHHKRIAIIGFPEEVKRIGILLKEALIQPDFIKKIYPASGEVEKNAEKYDAKIYQLKDAVEIFKIEEIIFCSDDIRSRDIITNMLELAPKNINYKIAPPDSAFIVGSSSIDKSGEFYLVETNPVTKAANKRKKRTLDLLLCILFLLTSPLLIWLYKKKPRFLVNCFTVLKGEYSWVHIRSGTNEEFSSKPGILQPYEHFPSSSDKIKEQLSLSYLRSYALTKDLEIILKNITKLDKKPENQME